MNWIRINRDDLNLGTLGRVRKPTQRRVVWSLPPADIPDAFQISPANGGRALAIKIRYLNSESELEDDDLGSGVVLRRGKATGRVYEVVVDIDPGASLPAYLARLEVAADLIRQRANAFESRPIQSFRTQLAEHVVKSPPLRSQAPV